MPQTCIAHDQYATIGLPSYQSSRSLLERDRSLGQKVVIEGTSAVGLEPLGPCLYQGIVRWGDRQLVDHDELQGVTGDIDSFPKRGGRDQDAPRATMPGTFPETLDQFPLRSLALDQNLQCAAF